MYIADIYLLVQNMELRGSIANFTINVSIIIHNPTFSIPIVPNTLKINSITNPISLAHKVIKSPNKCTLQIYTYLFRIWNGSN